MKTKQSFKTALFPLALLSFGADIFAQVPTASASSDESAGIGWLFIIGLLIVIGIGAIVAWRAKQKDAAPIIPAKRSSSLVYKWNPEDSGSENGGNKRAAKKETDTAESDSPAHHPSLHGINIDDVKVKLEKIRFERLPINRLGSLKTPRPFTALPTGEEEELLKAIEDSDVEFVEDEEIRERALEVLAGYRTRNAVEAISQMAIYDISSSLRSQAVGILADIDHESVFESVILSCADPTREVRAAAAKSLFKLSFSRRDAWLRLADCGDSYRMSQAAKAAIEADFVGRSLERLVHKDVEYASEALALLALLIKAGETEELLDYMLLGEKKEIKLALLKVFEIVGDDGVMETLRELVETESLSYDIIEEVRILLESNKPEAAGREQLDVQPASASE